MWNFGELGSVYFFRRESAREKRELEIMHENEGGERRDEMRGGEVEEEKTSLVPVHE
jgi:hypothetical protein